MIVSKYQDLTEEEIFSIAVAMARALQMVPVVRGKLVDDRIYEFKIQFKVLPADDILIYPHSSLTVIEEEK